MLVFNTTYTLSPVVERDFLKWMSEVCLPTLAEDEEARNPRFFRIVAQGADERSFSLQVELADRAALARYQSGGYAELKQLLIERFGCGVLPFSTLLEEHQF